MVIMKTMFHDEETKAAVVIYKSLTVSFFLWSMLIIGCIDASVINDGNSIPQSAKSNS